jgi:Xaa-Pro aminopeptidase
MSVADKISLVQEKLRKEKAALLVFSALDDIAYLFNVRANDVDCNPVGLSYATVHVEKGVVLSKTPNKIPSMVASKSPSEVPFRLKVHLKFHQRYHLKIHL